ncbi:hypothetical protein VUR80DRAFT_10091 [Thermomyces stellatus]
MNPRADVELITARAALSIVGYPKAEIVACSEHKALSDLLASVPNPLSLFSHASYEHHPGDVRQNRGHVLLWGSLRIAPPAASCSPRHLVLLALPCVAPDDEREAHNQRTLSRSRRGWPSSLASGSTAPQLPPEPSCCHGLSCNGDRRTII